MKFLVCHLFLLVFAYVTEAADYLRRRSDSADKAISIDKPAKSKHPTVMHSKAAETHMFHEQKATQSNVWDCKDKDDRCPMWASNGECKKNPTFMLANCELSCDVCEADGSQKMRVGPFADATYNKGGDSSKVSIDAKDPSKVRVYKNVEEAFWGKEYMYVVVAYIPYALSVFIMAAIWIHLGGRIPPTEERSVTGGRDFEYGLCDTDHVFNHHMWICVCAFCCCPIRMADTYSKEGKRNTTPIIHGFWVALSITLLMGLFVDLTCGLGMLLFLCMAVYFRQKIRSNYGLPHGGATLAWDCLYWCFCPWCTAAQEARQIECAVSYNTGVMGTGTIANSGVIRR